MPLPTGRIFLPGRYTSEDLAQLDVYNKGIEQYNTSYDQYKADIDKYNKAIEAWNAGPRTEDFTGVEPTAPTQPGFTQEDIDQFQQEAQARAARNRNMMMTAIDVARSPEAYNLAGFGFAEGGNPVVEGVGSLYSFDERGAMSGPNADSMRYATPEEVEIGSYNYLADLKDSFNYHMSEAQKPATMIGGVVPAQTAPANRIAHAEEAERLRGMIEQFSDERAKAVTNYRDYLAAGGLPLYTNTEGKPYFKGFPEDLVNFRATNP